MSMCELVNEVIQVADEDAIADDHFAKDQGILLGSFLEPHSMPPYLSTALFKDLESVEYVVLN